MTRVELREPGVFQSLTRARKAVKGVAFVKVAHPEEAGKQVEEPIGFELEACGRKLTLKIEACPGCKEVYDFLSQPFKKNFESFSGPSKNFGKEYIYAEYVINEKRIPDLLDTVEKVFGKEWKDIIERLLR